eukprot:Phypoly_transcript_10812.p1 GENE.Phypoly_transcript_10812~~Phypoly_transcript_10812.p1  ORF type:complete len:366 (+),score=30.29 Phypoly_transcript_10812:84-1181(+)
MMKVLPRVLLPIVATLLIIHIFLFHKYLISSQQLIAPLNVTLTIKPNTTVLFMITSYTEEFARRQIVRETYLSIPSNRSSWLFVVGKGNITEKLLQEQAQYKDVYFLDCADGYYNLSDKIILGLKTAVENFEFKYVVKVDTDTYVDVPRLVDYILENGENKTTFYSGITGFVLFFPIYPSPLAHFSFFSFLFLLCYLCFLLSLFCFLLCKNLRFFRIKEFGWRALDPKIRSPSSRPVMYMLGGGYILSYNLAQYFADNGHLLQVWAPEDLTIGVHLQFLSVVPDTDPLAFLTIDKEMNCNTDFLMNHKVSSWKMYYLHYSLLESGRMCGYMASEKVRNAIDRRMKEKKKKETTKNAHPPGKLKKV